MKRSSAATNREAGMGTSRFSTGLISTGSQNKFSLPKDLEGLVGVKSYKTTLAETSEARLPVWKASHSKVRQKNMLISML